MHFILEKNASKKGYKKVKRQQQVEDKKVKKTFHLQPRHMIRNGL